MTPRIARWIVIAATALAVLVAAAGRGGPENGAESSELVLRYVYSTDADDLLEPLIERYNRETHRSGGREIRVDGHAVASGEAEAALAARRERAALWTPASSIWGALLNHDVGSAWVAPGSPNLVFSPQVIAIWKRFADALGWPQKQIRWKDIVALATSERGWADYGHPEYGRFLLGHTNPGYSTSGLSAVASHYYAVTGNESSLTLADVQRPDVRAAVRRIEHSIVHYGETASKLIEKMLKYGTPYAHAVYVQETTWRGLEPQQQAELVRIKPADGTFVADYPLIVLAADWVSAETSAAARAFRRWLVPEITARIAAENDFDVPRPTGFAELVPPKADVLAAIQDAWHEDRKPANIVLVVDTSDSMAQEGRLEAAKQGLRSFLGALQPADRVELVTSGDSIETNVPLGVLGTRRQAVFRAVDELIENGDQPVYAAVGRALEHLRTLDDPDRINAVVVLSDGASTTVGRTELLQTINAAPVTEGTSVRIFTVAYDDRADVDALRRIASDSDGAFFPAAPKDIKDVYASIFSYF